MSAMEQKVIEVALLAAVLLLIITTYFITTLFRQHRRLSKWQEARVKAEVDRLEQERNRIATDLHDDIGPSLSGIKLQLEQLEINNEDDKQLLDKSLGQIDDVITNFRTISYNLLPGTLVRSGLQKTVEEFIWKVQQPFLDITFTSAAILLSHEQQLGLFRIIEEIIHNTIKHSRATSLDITITADNNAVRLISTDDGIGFEYSEKAFHYQGIGLLSIQSRVAILKGNLNIKTKTGEGTKFVITIPLINEQHCKK